MRSATRIRNDIVRRMTKTMIEFDTEELEFMLSPSYGMPKDVLEFMEMTVFARTTRFRSRCQLWEHKIALSNTRYPTLTKLVVYRKVYENWDGQEPFPGRDSMKIKYYLD